MNFDIKDIKSWANRHDVKVGDKGYFANNFYQFKNNNYLVSKVLLIFDDFVTCFGAEKDNDNYGFFLPLDKVKEDKPKEKKYRAFESLEELKKLFDDEHFGIGYIICFREKETNAITNVMITSITHEETGQLICLNGCNVEKLFKYFEVKVGHEWLPFGVEVKDNEN